MTAISPSDGRARFLGVVLLVALALLSLIDFSQAWGDSAWLAVALLAGVSSYCLMVVQHLVRAPAAAVRTAWIGAIAVAFATLVIRLFAAALSSSSSMVGWLGPAGVIAALMALALIGLAAVAMRELTLHGVAHRHQGHSARAPLAVAACVAFLLLVPGVAMGSASPSPGAQAPPTPLFGTTVLVVLFSLSAGYVAWGNRVLALRLTRR